MGISVPSTQYIVELAGIFKVTTDYLLGVSTEQTINIDGLSEKQVQAIYALLGCFDDDLFDANHKS